MINQYNKVNKSTKKITNLLIELKIVQSRCTMIENTNEFLTNQLKDLENMEALDHRPVGGKGEIISGSTVCLRDMSFAYKILYSTSGVYREF